MASSGFFHHTDQPPYSDVYQYAHINYTMASVTASSSSLNAGGYPDSPPAPRANYGNQCISPQFIPHDVSSTARSHPSLVFLGGTYNIPHPDSQSPYPSPAQLPQSPQPYPSISYPPYPCDQTNTVKPLPHIPFHVCEWGAKPCNTMAPGKNREMGEHLREFHDFIGNEKDSVPCYWGNCDKSLQRMNMGRHIVSTHLRQTTICPRCNKSLSRPDVASRHEKQCGK
ncbi:hypothetical protein EDD17DRAFT_16309 [Pisolithus thermaeus]|nr:hypothetical protein EDD17DRAFT_16309 [Pisolithus thermaeus]